MAALVSALPTRAQMETYAWMAISVPLIVRGLGHALLATIATEARAGLDRARARQGARQAITAMEPARLSWTTVSAAATTGNARVLSVRTTSAVTATAGARAWRATWVRRLELAVR